MFVLRFIALLIIGSVPVTGSAQVNGSWERIKDPPQGQDNRWRTYLALDGTAAGLVVVSRLNDGTADTGATVVEHSTDGGETWRDITPPGLPKPPMAFVEVPTIRSVAHPTADLIVAVGDDGLIARSDNSGESWNLSHIRLQDTTIHQSGYDQPFNTVSFSDSLHGIIVAGLDFVLQTEDGGRSWTVDTIAEGPFGFSELRGGFINRAGVRFVADYDGNLWRMDSFGSMERIEAIVPGGEVWSTRVSFSEADEHMWMAGSYTGAVGDSKRSAVLRSRENGSAWDLRLNSDLPAMRMGARVIDFADGMNGIIAGVGDSSLHTTDGGETWVGVDVPIALFSPIGLTMISPDNAIAIAVNGDMLRWLRATGGVRPGHQRSGENAPQCLELGPVHADAADRLRLSVLYAELFAPDVVEVSIVDMHGVPLFEHTVRIGMGTSANPTTEILLHLPFPLPLGVYFVVLNGCGQLSAKPMIINGR